MQIIKFLFSFAIFPDFSKDLLQSEDLVRGVTTWPKTALSILQLGFYFSLFCSIFILLSRESDGALYFGQIRTRLGVVHFQVFRLFL